MGANNEKSEKEIRVSFCPKCDSRNVKYVFELRNFFEDYKKLENKSVVVEDFLDKNTAKEILQASIELYNTTYLKK
jgi:inorganic pyrophosphatase